MIREEDLFGITARITVPTFMLKWRFWIRDIYLFREDYRERYLENVCTTNDLLYDNLPFVDGNRFSGNGIRVACIW